MYVHCVMCNELTLLFKHYCPKANFNMRLDLASFHRSIVINPSLHVNWRIMESAVSEGMRISSLF